MTKAKRKAARRAVAESDVPAITVTPAPERVVVDVRRPVVDAGRYPAKATIGELVVVEADVYAEGHDHVAASLWVRPPGGTWAESVMDPTGNDRWRGSFTPATLGRWDVRVDGWIDRFDTWRSATQVKFAAGVDVDAELVHGVELLAPLEEAADAVEAPTLAAALDGLRRGDPQQALLDHELVELARRRVERTPVTSSPAYPLQVEVERARFSAWYELFPRSTVDGAVRHGTLADTIDRLAYVADLGFDVVYLPPVHPIGQSFRKGPNNTLESTEADTGSPWAIGAATGGHTAVHPELGTVDDVAPPGRGGGRARPGAGPRHRLPVLARSPLGPRAPRVVPAPSRRDHPVRREPAEEVPGHLPVRLRVGAVAGPVGRAGAAWCGSGSARASPSSGSTTPTRSRSPSGSG